MAEQQGRTAPLKAWAMDFPAIIRDEMRVEARRVPERLDDCCRVEPELQLRRDSFIFTTPRGTRFHYAIGQGIAIEQSADGSDAETGLFYHGTVYGAVVWLNGLVPLHASSVAKDGKVIAFTAKSGEGKSTLAAALARHGFEHRSDDVLLLEIKDRTIRAWPDRERIKLCKDAFDLTGAEKLAAIEPGASKFFAKVHSLGTPRPQGQDQSPLPLRDLVVLESREQGDPQLAPCTGAGKLPLIVNAMYRIEIPIWLRDEQRHREHLARLATGLKIWTLSRQRSRDRFADDIGRIVHSLEMLKT